MRLFSILFLLSLLSSCGQDYSQYDYTKVTYKYNDSSVAPPYHRSYSIAASKEGIQLEVRDYDGIRLDTSFHVSGKHFETLKQLCKAQNKESTYSGKLENGGNSEEFYFFDTSGLIHRYTWLGGESTSYLAIINHLKSLIPDFKTTLNLRNRGELGAGDGIEPQNSSPIDSITVDSL
ncbi:MAG: hypothetical protein GY810_24755 [Aureispira sp.]|nr:hypothetical protein [Aureispira sp.]